MARALAARIEELGRVQRVVRAARRLLASPQRWTRGELARNIRGRAALPDHPMAARWCLAGALLREAALLDKRPLQRKKGRRGPLSATDLVVTETGELAIELAGLFLARSHEASRVGVLNRERRSFRFRRGGRLGSPVSIRKLPEIENDRSDVTHRDIAELLRQLDRATTQELQVLRARQKQLETGSAPATEGEGAGASPPAAAESEARGG